MCSTTICILMIYEGKYCYCNMYSYLFWILYFLKWIDKVWKFSTFLPLWFFVKSFWAGYRRSKPAISTIFESLNLDFWEFHTLEYQKIKQNSKIIAAKMVMGSFWSSEISQNWFHIKSEWQKNPQFSTVCASKILTNFRG